MTQTNPLQRRATPLLLAAIATLALLTGCDRRASDPPPPATSGTPATPPADTVPGTTPGAMPPASAASN